MTRRSWVVAAVAITALAVLVTSCGAEVRKPSNIVAADAWAPATADGATRGFVFLTLTADNDDELIEAAADTSLARLTSVYSGLAADTVGGHLGHLDGEGAPDHDHGDPSRIRLTEGVAVELRPGEGRIILDELLRPLAVGDTFSITLDFASGATAQVVVTVRPSE